MDASSFLARSWLIVFLFLAAKGNFISDTGLAGFAMFETGGDSNDILLDSIRAAMLGAADNTEDC